MSPCSRVCNGRSGKAGGPAFWRGEFEVAKPADTFLDVSTWGKGVLWVNGRCLGRFWNIGPTQTMYVPGPWLKPGRNEVIVLDLLGPQSRCWPDWRNRFWTSSGRNSISRRKSSKPS